MNNEFDKLKLENQSGEEDLVVSVNASPEDTEQTKKKKVTVFTMFASPVKTGEIKLDGGEETQYTLPVPKYTFLSLALVGVIIVVLTLLQRFVEPVLFIPIVMVFSSTAFSCLTLVFFVEFNTRRNIRGLHVAIMIVLGVFSYLLVRILSTKLLSKFMMQTLIDSFAVPIIRVLLLLVFVFFFSNCLHVTKLPECFLISVAFAVGYSVCESLLSSFDNLFMLVNIPVQDGGKFYLAKAIIYDELSISLGQMLRHWFTSYFYMPALFSAMAVIVGTAVSFVERAKIDPRAKPKSIFLLVILSILLYAVATLETNFGVYNIVLKAFALAVSWFVEFRLLNSCLDRECN